MFNWRDCYISFVNLPHRTDRLAHMVNELSRVGLSAVKTVGIYPNEFDRDDPRFQMQFRRTPGSLGCWSAQVSIAKKALELNKSGIILEDDLVFASDTIDRLDYIQDYINVKEPNFDIFFLGGTVHCNRSWWHGNPHYSELPTCHCTLERDGELTDDPRIIRTYGMFSTHAWIVNKNAIQKILDLLDSFMQYSIGIDHALINFQPQLRCFAFVPGTVKQMDNLSDIGYGETKFSGFSKLNGSIENSKYWWQDKMTDFDPVTFNWAEYGNR